MSGKAAGQCVRKKKDEYKLGIKNEELRMGNAELVLIASGNCCDKLLRLAPHIHTSSLKTEITNEEVRMTDRVQHWF
jgi:hypothetical protein